VSKCFNNIMSPVKWTVDGKEGWGNLPPEYVEKLMCLCYVKLSHSDRAVQLYEWYCWSCWNLSTECSAIFLCKVMCTSIQYWHSLFHYLHFAFVVTVYVCLSVLSSACDTKMMTLQCTYDIHKRFFLTDVCSSFSIPRLLLFTSCILVVSNRLDVFT